MRDVVRLRVARFPAADEQVEREVVDPTGEEQRRLGEEERDVGERSESALRRREGECDEDEIEDRDRQRDAEAGDERCDAVPGEDDQEQPAEGCQRA